MPDLKKGASKAIHLFLFYIALIIKKIRIFVHSKFKIINNKKINSV